MTETEALRWCVGASDRCVMCGLCLPHCPTYTFKRNEADSPRGRISLIGAFTASKLAPDKTLIGHLDGCLQCRRCEAVCPAQVPFGQLMDTTKSILFKARSPALVRVPRYLEWLVRSRALRRFVRFNLSLYQRSGLQRLLRASGLLKTLRLDALEAMLPATCETALPANSHPQIRDGKSVILFTGCVAEIFDLDTLAVSKRLLEAAGFAVTIPARQSCCGALHQHAGDAVHAQRFIRQNASAFNNAATNKTPPTVISCASGCGAQLKEHEATLDIRHFDIHAFLETRADALDFRPLDKTVALHTPCTMDSCLKDTAAVFGLLKRVPKLKVAALPNSGCCGAAGAYMLTQARTAQALMEYTLKPLTQTDAEILLSANVGCIMHLRQGIARRGMNIEVIHPTVLLGRQLARVA